MLRKYLPEFVYGSVDGIVTTVAVITGSIGIGLPAHIIFILGIANVFADGFSMGSSKFLSSISYNQIKKIKDNKPKKEGFATFISFVFIGFIPLLPFLISIFKPSFINMAIISFIFLSLFSFIFVGYISAITTNTSYIKNILRTVIIGSLAAGISYIIGYILNNIF